MSQYTVQLKVPELLERAKAQTTQLAIRKDGSTVVCTGGTYTLKDPSNNIVKTGNVTVTDDIATFGHSAGDLPSSLNLGEGYQQIWELDLFGDPNRQEFARNVSLVIRKIYPVISDFDLRDEYHTIDQDKPSTLPSWQSFIDSAWAVIIQDLRKKGNLEYLIMTPDSLRELHLNLTLYKIFRAFHAFSGNAGGAWFDLAKEHQELAEHEWNTLTFDYDFSKKGRSSGSNKRTTSTPIVFLNG